MAGHSLKVLDYTLRDGGYINDWRFGYQAMKNIVKSLMDANIDVKEVGFLRNENYDKERSVWPDIAHMKDILQGSKTGIEFSAMILHGNYPMERLEEWDGSGIDQIRVTFHDYDVVQGLAVCRQVKEKGYKVSCNPINIMGYSDIRPAGNLVRG